MEDKREGSSSPSSVSTLPSVPLGSPPPPGSPSEVSSRRLHSSVFEQGGPSERIPMVDPSSDKEDLILDTSRDEEFAKILFGDLSHKLLGPPSDGKVTILSDSNEEHEVHEEDAADVDVAPSFVVKSPAPTASAVDADDAPEGAQDGSNVDRTPDRTQGGSCSGGDEAGLSWVAAPNGVSTGGGTGDFKNNSGPTLLLHKFFCKGE
jgi:hypothetical protein